MDCYKSKCKWTNRNVERKYSGVLMRTLTRERSSSGKQMGDLKTIKERRIQMSKNAQLKFHNITWTRKHQKEFEQQEIVCCWFFFTMSSLSAPALSPLTHIACCHQRQDDSHKQEAHSSQHTSQQGLRDNLQVTWAQGVNLHPCNQTRVINAGRKFHCIKKQCSFKKYPVINICRKPWLNMHVMLMLKQALLPVVDTLTDSLGSLSIFLLRDISLRS